MDTTDPLAPMDPPDPMDALNPMEQMDPMEQLDPMKPCDLFESLESGSHHGAAGSIRSHAPMKSLAWIPLSHWFLQSHCFPLRSMEPLGPIICLRLGQMEPLGSIISLNSPKPLH